jgi:hypothetical protein
MLQEKHVVNQAKENLQSLCPNSNWDLIFEIHYKIISTA